jgi:hypothetical protein
MSLIIAWRNPQPPTRASKRIRRIVQDGVGTVYLVTDLDATHTSFELYPGGEVTLTSSATLARKTGDML